MSEEFEATTGEKIKHVLTNVGKGALKGLMWGVAIAAVATALSPFAWVNAAVAGVSSLWGGAAGTGLLAQIGSSAIIPTIAKIGAAFGLVKGVSTLKEVDEEKLGLAMRQHNLMNNQHIMQARMAQMQAGYGMGMPTMAANVPNMGMGAGQYRG